MKRFLFTATALAFALAPAAYAQSQFQSQPQSVAVGEFLKLCNSNNVTYDRLKTHIGQQGWGQIVEDGVVDEFFPEMANDGVEGAAVFQYNVNNPQTSAALYVGVLKARVPEGLILVCQLRNYDQSVDGLREAFEDSLELQSQRIESPEDSEVYNYSDGSGTAFYDVWERKYGEGDYVFTVGKTIVYAGNNGN